MKKIIICLFLMCLSACAHREEPLNAYDMEDYSLTQKYGFEFNPDLFNPDGRAFLASGDVKVFAADMSALMVITGQDDKTINTMLDLMNKIDSEKRSELLKNMVFYRDIYWIQSIADDEDIRENAYTLNEFKAVPNKDEYFISLLNNKKHSELTSKEKAYILNYYQVYLEDKINKEHLQKMLGRHYGKLYN